MNKTQHSVSVSASIHADKRSRSGFAPLFIKAAILFCSCLGSVFTFLTCIDLGVSFLLTAAVIISASLIFTLLFSLKAKYFAAASSISILIFIAEVFFYRNDICAGIANMLNTFLARIKVEYRETPYIYIIEPELSEHHLTIFVCFAAIFICMAAAYFIMRRPFAAMVCVVTAIPVFSVLMFGLEPNYIAFFGVITCWAAVLAYESSAAERISDKQCKKCSSYCAFSAAVFSALSIIIIIFSMKLFGYQRPERLNAMYDNAVEYINGGNVQQVIDNIITIATRNNSPSGAINHGKLGEFDDIHFDGNTVLQVTIPKSEDTIYLRGFVGSVYTGNSWEQLPSSKLSELEKITDSFSNEGLSPLLFDSYNLKYIRNAMPQYSFSVKNISANNKYLYMPYNLVPESVSRYETIGGSSFGGSSQSYFGQFYDPKEYYGYRDLFRKRWSVPSALSADEAAYRQFVYENYLDLPDGFSRTDIFSESYYKYITAEEVKTGKSTLDEMTVFSRKLYYIKKWLRDNCEYSLSAGKLPAGEDFVEYFLDNRKGSCSHFASAAVIMCRYAGIPARYVEGYIIKPMDFPAGTTVGTSAKIDVSDARGHAWVEIYIDGFGWYPMEFTSGYGNVRTAIPTETTVTTESFTELS
ncbi:MAG: transglutaminase family protein, partial [Oscillospiraceae bacterium]